MLNSQPEPASYWWPRASFSTPISEISTAQELLSNAANAHVADDRALAESLIREADIPEVRVYTERHWGSIPPSVVRTRPVDGLLDTVDKKARDRDQPLVDCKRAIIARDGYICRFCGMPVIDRDARKVLTDAYPAAAYWGKNNVNTEQHAALQCMWQQFDHLIPRSKGGRTNLENLVTTCAPCNYGRAEKFLEEVGLIDPRSRPIIRSDWDGLTRILPK